MKNTVFKKGDRVRSSNHPIWNGEVLSDIFKDDIGQNRVRVRWMTGSEVDTLVLDLEMM